MDKQEGNSNAPSSLCDGGPNDNLGLKVWHERWWLICILQRLVLLSVMEQTVGDLRHAMFRYSPLKDKMSVWVSVER